VLPILDHRSYIQSAEKCSGYYDRYHHDGGDEHIDRYDCERPKGHLGNHLDYSLLEDHTPSMYEEDKIK
jgi:hypothetical protein